MHSAASREATKSGGGSVLRPIPSLLLFRSDPHRGSRSSVCVCIVCLCACVCVRACVSLLVRPTYRRLLATLLRRAHRLAGTRRTCPHRVVSDSTGCPGKNLPDLEPRGRPRNGISRRGRTASRNCRR